MEWLPWLIVIVAGLGTIYFSIQGLRMTKVATKIMNGEPLTPREQKIADKAREI